MDDKAAGAAFAISLRHCMAGADLRLLGVSHALSERLGREAAKDHGVHSSNSSACQHGDCMAAVQHTGSGVAGHKQDSMRLADV